MATIREIVEFYTELENNGNGYKYKYFDEWIDPEKGFYSAVGNIGLNSEIKDFKVNPPKPKLQKIDLTACIKSNIDMVFASSEIGKLESIKDDSAFKFVRHNDEYNDGWARCRVRENHIHFNQGCDYCPLPQGLKVKLYYTSGDTDVTTEYRHKNWDYCLSTISGFEVLGVADGYSYD